MEIREATPRSGRVCSVLQAARITNVPIQFPSTAPTLAAQFN